MKILPTIFILGWFLDMNGCTILEGSVESVRPVLLHARNKLNNDENVKSVIDGIKALKKELYT